MGKWSILVIFGLSDGRCSHPFTLSPFHHFTIHLLTFPWKVREAGNVVVDSPRLNGKLAKALDREGGVDFMVLSHIDDVGDHQR